MEARKGEETIGNHRKGEERIGEERRGGKRRDSRRGEKRRDSRRRGEERREIEREVVGKMKVIVLYVHHHAHSNIKQTQPIVGHSNNNVCNCSHHIISDKK